MCLEVGYVEVAVKDLCYCLHNISYTTLTHNIYGQGLHLAHYLPLSSILTGPNLHRPTNFC